MCGTMPTAALQSLVVMIRHALCVGTARAIPNARGPGCCLFHQHAHIHVENTQVVNSLLHSFNSFF